MLDRVQRCTSYGMHIKEDPETKFESERKRLLDEYRLLTTKRLLNEYYVRLYRDVLVSQADAMESAGAQPADIQKQRELDIWTRVVFGVIAEVLYERGADPWKTE